MMNNFGFSHKFESHGVIGVLGANDANVPIGDEPETKMVKNTMEFVSLEKALAADWTSLPKSRFKRMDASAYFLLMTIFEFQSR